MKGKERALWYTCRLAEEEIVKHVTTTDADIGRAQALSLLRSWYLKTPIKHAGSSISNRCAAPHRALALYKCRLGLQGSPWFSMAQQQPAPAPRTATQDLPPLQR